MKRLIVVAALLAAGGIARADESLFAQANRDYAACNWAAAIVKYEQLVQGGMRHESLFYNLGNAYYRSATATAKDKEHCQLGPPLVGMAILSYERALALDPSLDDASYNLSIAREVVAARYGADKVKDAAEDPLWIRLATWQPLGRLAWGFLALDALFFMVLLAVRFLSTGFLRTGLVVGNVFIGVAALLAGVLLAMQVYFVETVKMGVVVADEVVMREGPDNSRREMPKLHAGHRAQVLREDHGWLRIRLANKMEGWVPRESVEQI